jgi:hypothetical protein
MWKGADAIKIVMSVSFIRVVLEGVVFFDR